MKNLKDILAVTFFVALSVAFTASLGAAPAPTQSTKLTYAQASTVLQALLNLDGYVKPVDQGPGKPPTLVVIHYEFTGVVRKAIAHDIRTLQDALADDDAAKASIIKAHNITNSIDKDGKPLDSPAETAKANAEWAQVQATPLQITTLTAITPDDLNLDANSIPATTVAALEPLQKP